MNRDKDMIVRVSEEERQTIKRNAELNGMRLSDFVRYACLGTKKINISITTDKNYETV